MASRNTTMIYSIVLVLIAIFSAGESLLRGRILKGENASVGEFPYMVSLQRDEIHFCGGAIITDRHILTAAHCFVGKTEPPYTKDLTVVTGATKKHRDGQRHNVLKVVPHSGFIRGPEARWRHDIAVVTLSKSIIFNGKQQKIALPKADTPGNVTAILTGWGQLSRTEDEPENLQKRNVSILTNKECNDKSSNMLDSQICGFDGKGTGFCNGDSGSPLVYNKEVVGVVSFAVSCGIGYPDLYTRIYHYSDFIKNAIS